jgi:hypothetical protein
VPRFAPRVTRRRPGKAKLDRIETLWRLAEGQHLTRRLCIELRDLDLTNTGSPRTGSPRTGSPRTGFGGGDNGIRRDPNAPAGCLHLGPRSGSESPAPRRAARDGTGKGEGGVLLRRCRGMRRRLRGRMALGCPVRCCRRRQKRDRRRRRAALLTPMRTGDVHGDQRLRHFRYHVLRDMGHLCGLLGRRRGGHAHRVGRRLSGLGMFRFGGMLRFGLARR